MFRSPDQKSKSSRSKDAHPAWKVPKGLINDIIEALVRTANN